MQLQATSAAGKRFVELAESHVETFRERAARHDRDGSFPAENFDDLRKSGAVGNPDRKTARRSSSMGDAGGEIERLASSTGRKR